MAGFLASLLPAVISGIGSLVSGREAASNARRQNAAEVAAIRENNRFIQQQNETRVQTLVKDARAAGIHPLAALGSSVAGSFATPQAAFGGAPITGSAVGDAISEFGRNITPPQANADLQTALLKAQIRNVDASTANMLADATSRSQIGKAQANMIGPMEVVPGQLGAAQKAQDDFGDIWEQIFGTANIKGVNIAKPSELGPLAYNFYRFLLGPDFKSGTGDMDPWERRYRANLSRSRM